MSRPTCSAPPSGPSDNPTPAGLGSQNAAPACEVGPTSPLFLNLGLWFGEPDEFLVWWEQIKTWAVEMIDNGHP